MKIPSRLRTIFVSSLLLISLHAYAQVTITPAGATSWDTVTILFNAAEGNAALEGDTGSVFMHTGLITPASTTPSDWMDVVDVWGTVDSNTLMTPLGGNLYTKTVYIPAYYGIDSCTIVNDLAFVFRNADGSVVGRTSTGGDIFVPLALTPGSYAVSNYVSHTQSGNTIQITATSGITKIEAFKSGIRVTKQSDSAAAMDSSYAIVDSLLQPFTPVVTEDSLTLSFVYDATHTVVIRKSPVTVTLVSGTDTLFAEINSSSSGGGSCGGGAAESFVLHSNEAIWGGGSRSGNVNLYGNAYQLNNQANYGYGDGELNLNISIPFFVSSTGYGIFFDNQYIGNADIGNSDATTFAINFTGGPLRYFLIPGNSFHDISSKYIATIGSQPLPPLWAMGYIQSKYGYQTTEEATTVVNQMQAQDFPISGIVLDLYWFGGTSDMGNLDWDESAFAGHNEMMANFLDSGVKTIVITEPYFTLTSSNYTAAADSNYFSTISSGTPYVISGFWAGTASLLDVTKPAAGNWFWNFYQARITDGVSGFWSDLGEPETDLSDMFRQAGGMNETHNIFALDWEKIIYTGYQQHYPGVRMFNLCRSGYAGMQRYSAFPWSGDVQRTFSGMQAQIPIMINMGMSGVGYMHNDIGGFTGGGEDDELYTRWQQMGAFDPIERAHGTGAPTAPIDYPVANQVIIRTFTKLRMSMLPYNYSLAWQNSTLGTPLVRGIFYEDSGFTASNFVINDEYLWGPNVLVAPVMVRGAANRSVTFPTGDWFSWWDNSHYSGNTTATISTPLSTMPLFMRGDALVPTTPAVNSTVQYDTKTLQIHYFPADSSKTADFTSYIDDGVTSTNLATGNYRTLHFTARHGQGGDVAMWLDLSQHGGYAGEPALRSISYIVHNVTIPSGDSVFLSGAGGVNSLPEAVSLTDFAGRDSVYFYDDTNHTLYTKYTSGYDSVRMEVKYESLTLKTPVVANIFNISIFPNPFIDKLNIDFTLGQSGNYSLNIFDMSGHIVYTRILSLTAGRQSISYDGSGLAAGNYFISLSGQGGSVNRQVSLLPR